VGTIAGSNTLLDGAFGIAVDSDSGSIYASNSQTNDVTVYPGNPSGTLNEAPNATLGGSNTTINGPLGIALNVGNVFVANSGAGSVLEFLSINSFGNTNTAPYWTIGGSNAELGAPTGVAVDSDAVYVSNFNNDSITI
jgi:DNA-binding beta-propeller fold protein YncE